MSINNLKSLRKTATTNKSSLATPAKGPVDPLAAIKKKVGSMNVSSGSTNRLPEGTGVYVVNGITRHKTQKNLYFLKIALTCISSENGPVVGNPYEHAIFDAGMYDYDWREYANILRAVEGLSVEQLKELQATDEGQAEVIGAIGCMLGMDFTQDPPVVAEEGSALSNTIALEIKKEISDPVAVINKDTKQAEGTYDPDTKEFTPKTRTYTNIYYNGALTASDLQQAIENAAIEAEVVYAGFEGKENFERALTASTEEVAE